VVELPWAADCCPCVEKLRTVLPFNVGIRDGWVHLVSTLGNVVTSAREELGSITAPAWVGAQPTPKGPGARALKGATPLAKNCTMEKRPLFGARRAVRGGPCSLRRVPFPLPCRQHAFGC
jgi:hypothetical protein